MYSSDETEDDEEDDSEVDLEGETEEGFKSWYLEICFIVHASNQFKSYNTNTTMTEKHEIKS